MGINRNITTAKAVIWNGDEVARVRGLTPNNLATVLQLEGSNLREALDALDQVDLQGLDGKDSEAVAGRLVQAAPAIIVHLTKVLPRFLAAVIVVAADGEEDDIDYVAAEWPVALQFLALTEIAVLTFSGPEGFKAFVGNAFALAGLAKTLTGANTGTAASTPSESGSTPYSS